MNTRTIMHQWHQHIQSLCPQLHFYQCQNLALFSFAVALSQNCCLSRICAHVPSNAQPPSTKRRLLRFLGNARLDVPQICLQMASWLRRWNAPWCRLLLLLDETPWHNCWRVLKISVAWKRRAIPLCWLVFPLKKRHKTQPEAVFQLLSQAQEIIQTYAPQAQVEFLADRGFCWPQIVRWCQSNGWDYIIRAPSQTRFRSAATPHHPGIPVCQLVGRGEYWCGSGEIFKHSGWMASNIVVCWPERSGIKRQDVKEPWLLITSLRPTLHCVRHYKRRMWHEESFRDEKSHGFRWQESQVGVRCGAYERVERFLLILALAQMGLMALGFKAVTQEWRKKLGIQSRATRKQWSLFRHGWQFLQWLIMRTTPLPRKIKWKIEFQPTYICVT